MASFFIESPLDRNNYLLRYKLRRQPNIRFAAAFINFEIF
jgi:hypothetical protein